MTALLVGYARVSTDEQDLTAQRDALASLGVAPERVLRRSRVDRDQPRASRSAGGARGVPKTGTTFLHRIMWQHRDTFAAAGFLYRGDSFGAHVRAGFGLRGSPRSTSSTPPPSCRGRSRPPGRKTSRTGRRTVRRRRRRDPGTHPGRASTRADVLADAGRRRGAGPVVSVTPTRADPRRDRAGPRRSAG